MKSEIAVHFPGHAAVSLRETCFLLAIGILLPGYNDNQTSAPTYVAMHFSGQGLMAVFQQPGDQFCQFRKIVMRVLPLLPPTN
jgi:hypothetical protein